MADTRVLKKYLVANGRPFSFAPMQKFIKKIELKHLCRTFILKGLKDPNMFSFD